MCTCVHCCALMCTDVYWRVLMYWWFLMCIRVNVLMHIDVCAQGVLCTLMCIDVSRWLLTRTNAYWCVSTCVGVYLGALMGANVCWLEFMVLEVFCCVVVSFVLWWSALMCWYVLIVVLMYSCVFVYIVVLWCFCFWSVLMWFALLFAHVTGVCRYVLICMMCTDL